MPRNGAGVASPVPGFNTVAASTTILSALHNSGINDIFTILNSAWPVALGGTGGTTQIGGWDAITAKGTDIASASTIVLTTATGPRIDITGTTSITAVTLANGSMRIARATGIFILTASATLVVNKSTTVNYTTAVGDLMIFTAEGGVTSVTVINAPTTAVTSGQTLLSLFPTDNEPPSTNYATFDVRNAHPILVFPDAVVYVSIFTAVLPRRYGGGGLTILINWMNSTTSTNKVCFSATLERMDVGTTDLDADSFGTQVIDTTGISANATSGIQSQTSIALTTGANMDSVVAGDCFRLKITRETGQANDTQAGDAQIVSIEIKET